MRVRGVEVEIVFMRDMTWLKAREEGRCSRDIGWRFGAKKNEAHMS